MDYEQIRFETRNAVGLITLNRPARLNAWTKQMSNEMSHAIGACNDDPAIGAIVITGEGRGFCAGADIEDSFKARLDGADPEADRGLANSPSFWKRVSLPPPETREFDLNAENLQKAWKCKPSGKVIGKMALVFA